MNEKTTIIAATLYVVGWIIFLIWKTFPNSKGISLSSVIRETAEDSPFSPGVTCAIMLGVMILGSSVWPYWVISRPIRKLIKKNES